jgi:hypothetical protein
MKKKNTFSCSDTKRICKIGMFQHAAIVLDKGASGKFYNLAYEALQIGR